MTTQHTPTPWTNDRSMAHAATVKRVADCSVHTGIANAEANAAFIVRAVNSHAALVEALEDILANEMHHDGNGNHRVYFNTEELDKALAALKLAKES